MEALIVVAAVAEDENGILLCQRPYDKPREAGKWEFPGGKVERGETPEAALERELMEELGVKARTGRLCDAKLTVCDTGAILILFYRCALEGAPMPLEHEKIEFVPREKLLTYDLADADRRAAITIIDDKEKTDA